MTLQLLPFEFPYRGMRNFFLSVQSWSQLFLVPSLLFIVILLLYYLFLATSLPFWPHSLIFFTLYSHTLFSSYDKSLQRVPYPQPAILFTFMVLRYYYANRKRMSNVLWLVEINILFYSILSYIPSLQYRHKMKEIKPRKRTNGYVVLRYRSWKQGGGEGCDAILLPFHYFLEQAHCHIGNDDVTVYSPPQLLPFLVLRYLLSHD